MESRSDYIFTSESVGEGHPDKICDQVADSVLDAALTLDPMAHVACEVFTTTGLVMVGGEITLRKGYIDIQSIVRGVLKKIGYDDPAFGIDYQSCAVISAIHEQSADIAQGVDGTGLYHEEGAGDQGMMFGFATTETPDLMPAPVQFANQIMLRASEVRKNGVLPFMRPDGKCQVTVEYKGGRPHRIRTVVLSHQHSEDVSYNDLREAYTEVIIKKCLPAELLKGDVKYLINPTGRFVIGGPHGDTGVTGRKIICDTYGGAARHGGGAFSGKDPTKVDRSAAYMARYAAKNVVAAGLAEKCEVQVAYAIGVAEPVSLYVTTFGTGKVTDERLESVVPRVFDFKPSGIIKTLDLRTPVYQPTSTYGHFGRPQFAWERTDKVEALKKALA